MKANREEAEDEAYQRGLSEWDATLSDVSRIANRQGKLERHYLTQVDAALRLVFGIL